MAIGYLNSLDLIATIKREAMIPTNQSTFQNADFLAMVNQELRGAIVPMLISFHEEYLVRDSEPVTIVANQSAYAIPYRAVGQKFRNVYYRDTNGNLMSMTRINPDQRPYYQNSQAESRFIYFYMQGNSIVLVPDVTSNPTGSLVFSYYMRPNDLVDPSRVATVISITNNGLTTDIQVNQIPGNFSPFQQGPNMLTGFSLVSQLDFMQSQPGHRCQAFDKVPVAINTVSKLLTFNSSDVPKTLIPGDYISFAGECIIPSIPSDLHDLLCQRVVVRCLLALGDQMGYQAAINKLQEMEAKCGALIDNRSEGEAQKINNLNGLLKQARTRRKGWI